MKLFKKWQSEETPEAPSVEDAPIVPVDAEDLNSLDDFVLERPDYRSNPNPKDAATFNPETGVLVVTRRYKDYDPEVLVYDLLMDPLRVTGQDNSVNPHLTIRNDNYKTYDTNFFSVDIAQADLAGNPVFAEALKDVLLRNLFIHGDKTVVEVDMDTWGETLKYSNRYRTANRLYHLDLLEALFDGVDEETLRACSTVTGDVRTAVIERYTDSDDFWNVVLQRTFQVQLTGEKFEVEADAELEQDGEERIVKIRVSSSGFDCAYALPVDPVTGVPKNPDALRPARMYRGGVSMTNSALTRDHNMGAHPGDQPYTRVFARMIVEDWVPFYKAVLDLSRAEGI